MSQKVTIACQQCRSKNYRTSKTTTDRLVLNKYCRTCQSKKIHKEEK